MRVFVSKWLILAVLVFGFIGFAWAGEKEELTMEVKYRVELNKNLQYQAQEIKDRFDENQELLKAAVKRLKEIDDAEKAGEVRKEGKKDGKK